jgi:hypothetical protein
MTQAEFDRAEKLVSQREVNKQKIDTPIVDAQDIKTKELANQTTETDIKDKQNTKTIANFQTALIS